MLAQEAVAQSSYTYFPSASTTDGRFLAIAGAGYNTLAGDTMRMQLGSVSTADSLEFAVFDGETGTTWDQGTESLVFTLYADPSGTSSGTSTTPLGTWSGSSMTNNAWTTIKVANATSARAPNGNYLYVLTIRMSDPTQVALSAFKLRCLGTISLLANQSFNILAPLSRADEISTIYPNWPSTTTTTYDGSWDFYLDVPTKSTAFTVMDGDMDYGNYAADTNDTDDRDTPNGSIPTFAQGTSARYEGVAFGDTAGGVMRTGYPCDNSPFTVFQRNGAITYEVIDPNGTSYRNNNPSGNLEWEQFKISTSTFDADSMDYHADSIPAGTYRVRISQMDLGNLNAWYFFNRSLGVSPNNEVLGMDESGAPVQPKRPYMISGKLYYDNDQDGVQDSDEPGIPSVTVRVNQDRNSDGVVDNILVDTTGDDGSYTFNELPAGSYGVRIESTTLTNDASPVSDPDGSSTAGVATVSLSGTTSTTTMTSANFTYQRTNAETSSQGTATRGYWVNHPEDWPVSSLTIAGTTYTKNECLAFLKKPTAGDKSYQMVAQLIAAKLNVANGCISSCITSTITAADTWLSSNRIGGKIRSWGSSGETTHNTLDDYNNGRMCASHMD